MAASGGSEQGEMIGECAGSHLPIDLYPQISTRTSLSHGKSLCWRQIPAVLWCLSRRKVFECTIFHSLIHLSVFYHSRRGPLRIYWSTSTRNIGNTKSRSPVPRVSITVLIL